MYVAAGMIGGDGLGRVAVTEGLGGSDLPRGKDRFGGIRFVVREHPGALIGRGHRGAKARGFRGLAVRVDEHVLEVGKLAADFIDSHAVRPRRGEPQTGARFDGLLLLGVAGENDLGAALLSDAKEIVEFAG